VIEFVVLFSQQKCLIQNKELGCFIFKKLFSVLLCHFAGLKKSDSVNQYC